MVAHTATGTRDSVHVLSEFGGRKLERSCCSESFDEGPLSSSHDPLPSPLFIASLLRLCQEDRTARFLLSPRSSPSPHEGLVRIVSWALAALLRRLRSRGAGRQSWATGRSTRGPLLIAGHFALLLHTEGGGYPFPPEAIGTFIAQLQVCPRGPGHVSSEPIVPELIFCTGWRKAHSTG